jgi:alpha-ketoglutarate-dependent taurine dioxygenase
MKTENIHDSWGTIISLESPDEFFTIDADFWRNLIYERKLIIFKQVNFTLDDYAQFSLRFGAQWDEDEYKYSREAVEKTNTLLVSPFSNANSRMIGLSEMPWHADIPNRNFKPFPFRSLWIVNNPNPEVSGKTKWLNLEKALDYLTPEMLQILPKVRILQQSWYLPGTDNKEFDLLKIHPITGARSLRLNYFNWLNLKIAWITGVKIDGVMQADCSLVKDWLIYLEQFPELIYQHTWDTYDIALYDNWSFVHARSRLKLDHNDPIRKFYRININHLNSEEWKVHKEKFKL